MDVGVRPDMPESIPGKRRVVTSARREQNRVAQQLFRQRQKAEKKKRQALRLSGHGRCPRPITLKPRQEKSAVPDASPNGLLHIRTESTAPEAPLQPPGDGTGRTSPPTEPTLLEPADGTQLIHTSHESEHFYPDCFELVAKSLDSIGLPHHEEHLVFQTTISALPSPYANTLRITRITNHAACITNAMCMRFDISRLASPDYISPFYNPGVFPSSDLTITSDPSIPPHLRPTLAQILFPHHVALDLIPIPEFRSRVIMLSASKVGIFDLLEFKKDVHRDDGLVCWCGPPWDMRSWEASPWFLEKWKVLVDGDDGELQKNSIRWRRLRGEE